MRFPRASGVLLHPTCLPGPHGSGDLGAEALKFVDWLVSAGQRLWQILPLGERWYSGLPDARGRHDLSWLRRTGEALSAEDWNNRTSRVLGALIGAPGRGLAPLLLLINGRDHEMPFRLPPGDWQAVLDTTHADGASDWRREGALEYPLLARSVVLLRDAASD